jgi:hypothetical protein
VVSVASIPGYGVEVLVGLVGHESQGCGCVPHPVVGGAVHPSLRAIFGRWDAVSVVIAWRCCLVRAGVCRDGACPQDSYPLSLGGVSGACLSLSGLAYLMEPDPSSSFSGVETEEGSCGAAKRAAEGAGRGRDGPHGLVLGPGPSLLR